MVVTTVVTAGRTDLDDYFRLSGVLTYKRLNHTPFLVFEERDSEVVVQIVYSARELLNFPKETKVMGQWRGEWRSYFFQFTVSDVQAFMAENNISS